MFPGVLKSIGYDSKKLYLKSHFCIRISLGLTKKNKKTMTTNQRTTIVFFFLSSTLLYRKSGSYLPPKLLSFRYLFCC